MDDPKLSIEKDPICGKYTPQLKDFWELKGAIIELAVITALFFAGLNPNSDFTVIIGLAIAVTVFAVFLIIMDIREMVKKRDFRKVLIFLLILDAVVLTASSVVLHYWRLLADGVVPGENYLTYSGIDAVILVIMIVIVISRLMIRARDRRIAEAEDGVLMENRGSQASTQV